MGEYSIYMPCKSKPEKGLAFVTDYEYSKIIETIRKSSFQEDMRYMDEAAYTLARMAGLTPSEIVNLSFGDLEIKDKEIIVNNRRTNNLIKD